MLRHLKAEAVEHSLDVSLAFKSKLYATKRSRHAKAPSFMRDSGNDESFGYISTDNVVVPSICDTSLTDDVTRCCPTRKRKLNRPPDGSSASSRSKTPGGESSAISGPPAVNVQSSDLQTIRIKDTAKRVRSSKQCLSVDVPSGPIVVPPVVATEIKVESAEAEDDQFPTLNTENQMIDPDTCISDIPARIPSTAEKLSPDLSREDGATSQPPKVKVEEDDVLVCRRLSDRDESMEGGIGDESRERHVKVMKTFRKKQVGL